MQDRAYTLRSLTLFVSSHFMFNVLAKLQSEILSGDKREAITTLSEYSSLMRKANEFSLMESISLKDELDFLKSYLTMETKRFVETPFEFAFIGFENIDLNIQPFILQPFLELAVLGGLNPNGCKIDIRYLAQSNEIQIESDMHNRESILKMQDKCDTAKKRLDFFGHQYQINERESRYLQKINILK